MILRRFKNYLNGRSFQRQLFLLLTISIFSIALIISLTATWLNYFQISRLMVNTGLQHVQNAARQSRLALLYSSSENAVVVAKAIIAFPDIIHIAIISSDMSTLYKLGKESPLYYLNEEDINEKTSAGVIYEDDKEWYFFAPVYIYDTNKTGLYDDVTILEGQENNIIGYVFLVASKESLNQAKNDNLTYNFIFSMILAVILIAVLRVLLNFLFSPLNSLADVMHKSITGNRLMNYTGDTGPKEIFGISIAYNNLVNMVIDRDEKLNAYNQILESTVEIRTQELVEARDVAIEADKHKSEFLANTTHELRTPLQSIIGYAEAAKEMALEEGSDIVISDMDNILHSANHLLSLINTLLDISKIEAGGMELSYDKLKLAELVSHAEKTIMPFMKKNGNTLHINLRNHEQMIQIDQGKLLQILLNLLSNAAKFTQNGTVTLNIDSTDKYLTFQVIDTGIGIAKEKQELIFMPFQQGDGGITRKYGGTGLGLAVTKQFCRLMGGDIKLYSEPGKGSTFEVQLPLYSSSPTEQHN